MKKPNSKILIVAPSLDIMGGQAVQAGQLLENLTKEGLRVDFLPINPHPPGILFYLTKIKYIRTLAVSFFYVISLFRRVKNYDIIHIFSAAYFSFILAQAPAIVISKIYGKKVILNYRSGEAEDHLKKWGWIAIPVMGMADKIVTPSGFLVDVFEEFGLKAEAVFNTVDFDSFEFKNRVKLEPKLLVARNLEKLYNVSCAIKSFEIVKGKFPRAQLVIIGYGKDEANLKDLVRNLNLKDVEFTGRVERDRIPDHYQKCDIFVNSSDIDNMPVSFLEAFSAGLPVVSTDSGGIPYIVKDGYNGLLVKTGNYEALAEKIIYLLENQTQALKLIRQAKDECVKYTWDSVKEDWFKVYSGLEKDEPKS